MIVDYKLVGGDKKIGYIMVLIFLMNIVKEFKMVLKVFDKKGVKKLVIDMCGNFGGLMMVVLKMVLIFLKNGKMIM